MIRSNPEKISVGIFCFLFLQRFISVEYERFSYSNPKCNKNVWFFTNILVQILNNLGSSTVALQDKIPPWLHYTSYLIFIFKDMKFKMLVPCPHYSDILDITLNRAWFSDLKVELSSLSWDRVWKNINYSKIIGFFVAQILIMKLLT